VEGFTNAQKQGVPPCSSPRLLENHRQYLDSFDQSEMVGLVRAIASMCLPIHRRISCLAEKSGSRLRRVLSDMAFTEDAVDARWEIRVVSPGTGCYGASPTANPRCDRRALPVEQPWVPLSISQPRWGGREVGSEASVRSSNFRSEPLHCMAVVSSTTRPLSHRQDLRPLRAALTTRGRTVRR